MTDQDDTAYDDAGRCIASRYRRGLRALGTNPRALGINPRRRKHRRKATPEREKHARKPKA